MLRYSTIVLAGLGVAYQAYSASGNNPPIPPSARLPAVHAFYYLWWAHLK